MLMKIRYGYGEQSHLEKREILHSWYSDLRAYLPILCAKKPSDYYDLKHWNGLTYQEMLKDAQGRLAKARLLYNPIFEGLKACSDQEKDYMVVLDGLKEVLDEITAISKIIDRVQASDDDGVKCG